jgi:hypothetical protein
MPDIIINGKRYKHRPYNIYLCRFCDHSKFPYGKPIDPIIDHDAVNLGKEWMCGECVREQKTIRDLFKMNKRL